MQSEPVGLSELQREALRRDGFLAPFDSALAEAEVSSVTTTILSHMRSKDDHPLYGRHSVRDWHLVYPELIRFVSESAVLKQLTDILGEDLVLWRSHVFYKPPGTGPIGWHQDFGTFSGEDIGNNKVSLVPSHLPDLDEPTLTQYLPDALAQSSPAPSPDQTSFWNITVWVALSSITEAMGPLRFIRGSHQSRHPVRMKSLADSDFWQNPFARIETRDQLVEACRRSKLVLDLDTSHILRGVPVESCSLEELQALVLSKLSGVRGSATVVDGAVEGEITSFPMSKGSYIIFSEKTLHGSNANESDMERLAINFRVTRASTLVYPSRLRGDYVDGFNIDIRNHRCVLISGRNTNPDNRVATLKDMQARGEARGDL